MNKRQKFTNNKYFNLEIDRLQLYYMLTLSVL